VPATAVVIDAQGTRVARVQDGAIAWRTVEIDRDLGDKVAISAGVTDGDLLVAAPTDRLVEGMRVRADESHGAVSPAAESASAER
jgi:hypothetical protein